MFESVKASATCIDDGEKDSPPDIKCIQCPLDIRLLTNRYTFKSEFHWVNLQYLINRVFTELTICRVRSLIEADRHRPIMIYPKPISTRFLLERPADHLKARQDSSSATTAPAFAERQPTPPSLSHSLQTARTGSQNSSSSTLISSIQLEGVNVDPPSQASETTWGSFPHRSGDPIDP